MYITTAHPKEAGAQSSGETPPKRPLQTAHFSGRLGSIRFLLFFLHRALGRSLCVRTEARRLALAYRSTMRTVECLSALSRPTPRGLRGKECSGSDTHSMEQCFEPRTKRLEHKMAK